jgi:hypothetical protein
MTIFVSGTFSGLGNPDYFLNVSRKSAFWPQLHIQGPDNAYEYNECPICTIEYEGFSPNKIINTLSRENDIYQNSPDSHKLETLTNPTDGVYPIIQYPYSPNYNSKIKYFVTDYNNLFFQYELLFNSYTEFSGIGIKNIYKNNENIIDRKNYKIQYSYDLLSGPTTRYSNTTWGDIQNDQIEHRIRVLLPYDFYSKENFYSIDYDKSFNGVHIYQKELIELRPIYNSGDFSITSTGLLVNPNGRLNKNDAPINIIKDINYRIYPLDIVTLKGQNSYLTDKDAQWKLRLNLGSFFVDSGVYTGASGKIYNLEQCYTDQSSIPLTNIKPIKVKDNIVQLKEHPIYLDETKYCYPYYTIETYDKTNTTLTDTAGKISIDINGKTRDDIKVKSIDVNKGYLELSSPLDITDEIEFSFYIQNSGYLYLEWLELNPKIPQYNDTEIISPFHINQYKNGLGIAILPYSGVTSYPYIYDLSLKDKAGCVSGIFGVDSSEPKDWNEDFFTICEINLNKLSTDMVKMTDARKIGGGVLYNSTLNSWFSNNFSGVFSNEKKWYSDNGRYDGEALSGSSFIIIHVPNEIIEEEKQKWIDYYKTYASLEEAEITAKREFNHYLNQTVRRYISAGSDFVIMPVISGVITGSILNLDN